MHSRGDADEARRSLNERVYTLLLCDVHMPGGSGFTLVRERALRGAQAPPARQHATALLDASSLAPGDAVRGTAKIANSGHASGRF